LFILPRAIANPPDAIRSIISVGRRESSIGLSNLATRKPIMVERLNGRIAEILRVERLSPPLICKRRSQATFGRTVTEFPNALGTT
jgi:hypothetical protein